MRIPTHAAPTHPGGMLAEEIMKPLGIRQRVFGMEAQFWLNLQTVWDLYQALHSDAVEEIARLKRCPRLAAASEP